MAIGTRDVSASVTDQITQLIVERDLKPGDPMPTEFELCEQMGVSRSSVREAVRTLAALDIVDVRHGTGTFVGHLSLQPLVNSIALRSSIAPGEANAALREIVEVRLALDLGFARTICASLQGKTHPELEGLVAEMAELSDRGESFAGQDRRFHRLLAQQSGNQLMTDLIDAFWAVHTQMLTNQGVPTPDDIRNTAQAHGAMLRAAQSGDVNAFRVAVSEHYAPLLAVLDRSEDEHLARIEDAK